MRILAIETSGQHGSVALLEKEVVSVRELPMDSATIQTLAVTIREILPSEGHVDGIAIANGPGSFTGLRIGLATAKMLAMAWRCPLMPIDTLAVLAAQAAISSPGGQQIVIPVINAFRRQVFSGAWQRGSDGELKPVAETQVVGAERWQRDPAIALGLPPSTRCLITGPGLEKYLPDQSTGYSQAAPACWHPSAETVARLGRIGFEQGNGVDAVSLLPNYVRASAAEEQTKPSVP